MKLLPEGLARTRLACYASFFTAASVFCVPPLLFVTFHGLYGISYTLLGTLIVANFFTQLIVDLVCTMLAKRHHVERVLRFVPFITALGMAVYALVPFLFPQIAYGGLLLGTVIFSVAAGLSEVLLSPTVAAIPSENPGRDMSLLHSLYGFGVFTMVLLGTSALYLFGTDRWYVVMLLLAVFPFLTGLLFAVSPIPEIKVGSDTAQTAQRSKSRAVGIALCFGCIFLGSCAENTMNNWISSYIESALGIDKLVGDVFGVAFFALLLAFARVAYAKFGKSICPVLLVGMIGSFACYLMAGLAPGTVLPFIACILTGLFASMLWPGTLILLEEKIPNAGVAAFALMAAAGDSGASIAPQLAGVIVDAVSAAPFAAELSASLALSPEALGLRAAMLTSSIFPLIGAILVLVAIRILRKTKICSPPNKAFAFFAKPRQPPHPNDAAVFLFLFFLRIRKNPTPRIDTPRIATPL